MICGWSDELGRTRRCERGRARLSRQFRVVGPDRRCCPHIIQLGGGGSDRRGSSGLCCILRLRLARKTSRCQRGRRRWTRISHRGAPVAISLSVSLTVRCAHWRRRRDTTAQRGSGIARPRLHTGIGIVLSDGRSGGGGGWADGRDDAVCEEGIAREWRGGRGWCRGDDNGCICRSRSQ